MIVTTSILERSEPAPGVKYLADRPREYHKWPSQAKSRGPQSVLKKGSIRPRGAVFMVSAADLKPPSAGDADPL